MVSQALLVDAPVASHDKLDGLLGAEPPHELPLAPPPLNEEVLRGNAVQRESPQSMKLQELFDGAVLAHRGMHTHDEAPEGAQTVHNLDALSNGPLRPVKISWHEEDFLCADEQGHRPCRRTWRFPMPFCTDAPCWTSCRMR